MILGFRPLKHPAAPDPGAPDYDAQLRRYREESQAWWDNWEHNFVLSLKLLLAGGAATLIVVIVLDLLRHIPLTS